MNPNRMIIYAAGASLAMLSLTAVPRANANNSEGSVFTALSNDPRFTTTMQMVYVAGAANRLSTAGDLTVFAATDTGWQNSGGSGKLSSLSSTGASSEFPDSMGILEVIRGFFVHGKPPQGATDMTLQSAAGKPIEFNEKTMEVKWVDPDGDAKSAHVDGKPIMATNGVIYPVDAVVGE